MPVVGGKEPSLYIDKKILTYKNKKISEIELSELTKDLEGFEGLTKSFLSNLLEKLTHHSVGFKLEKPKLEEDSEIRSWRYVLIKLKIEVGENVFRDFKNFLIEDVYSVLDLKDRSKILLVIDRV